MHNSIYDQLMVTFNVLRGEAPSYLRDLMTPYVSTRRLRSKNKLLLHQMSKGD